MAENAKMDGDFLGGGSLDFLIKEGEVYLHARQLHTIFGNAGLIGGAQAIKQQDEYGGAQAILMLSLAKQVNDLRSELLKQEAERVFNAE